MVLPQLADYLEDKNKCLYPHTYFGSHSKINFRWSNVRERVKVNRKPSILQIRVKEIFFLKPRCFLRKN